MTASAFSAAVVQFLRAPRCGVLSTIRANGAPHQVVVYYLMHDAGLVLNGRTDRLWARNVRRNPRVSFLVHDADERLHWVGIDGAAELHAEGQRAVDDAMHMARVYGDDPAPFAIQQRVSFLVRPSNVYEYAQP